MATNSSHRLLARLQRDLAELREQPYPGVAVFIDDADIRKFCLVLTPPAGPWKGLTLHFDVCLPSSWPRDPPQVSTSVHGMNHPNLYGSYICCDLLKPHEELQPGYTGGYTPALTLRGLFLQFLTFFSSTSVEQDYGGIIQIGDATVTTYITEEDLGSTTIPGHGCCLTGGCRACHPSKAHQLDLERRWKGNSTYETTIAEYKTTGGLVTHKVKGTKAHPDRIHQFEKPNPRRKQTYDLIAQWSCKKCPYGSPELPHDASDVAMQNIESDALYRPPQTCVLHLLNDDILLEIASHVPSEVLITFGQAYPRFQHLVSGHHIFLLRELQCFFLKTPLNQGILGIGVAFEPGPRTLSSDFDWLSLEAFTQHGVRKSIQKRDFEFFLPLAFNKPHFDRARQEIWSKVTVIDTAVRQANANANRGGNRGGRGGRGSAPASTIPAVVARRAQPHQAFTVLFKMMNNIVVSLMKTCDDALVPQALSSRARPNLLTASEKAVISYCHLIHLLICVCRSEPRLLFDAKQRAKEFLQVPASRTKASTPDMGEFIIIITLVLIMADPRQANGPSWGTINGPFLEEAIIRNVRWVLKDAPQLEVMEQGANEYRLVNTFAKSKTSLRLIMFQVTFLDLFIKTYHSLGIGALDRNYGFPESGLPEKMVEEIKAIYKVNSWPEFFSRVQYAKARAPGFTKEVFTGMLRSAVKTSAERGYHSPTREMHRLAGTRRRLEDTWNKGRTPPA
ncbi:hypothetical protein MD484_g3410, partial [Candolleomyces efflorescens]